MLRFLGVRRLAVIDELEVDFAPGLNIITGETGAGKSVLVEAIDLLLGGRASSDMVRTGEDAAAVQAIFEDASGQDTIVRREVSAQGRSRAYLNDALATTTALREFGRSRVELHGQHEQQSLLDPQSHGDVLDSCLESSEHLTHTAAAFDRWRAAAATLGRTTLDAREKRARIEIATFHLQDIDKVRPEAGEDERLDAEHAVLANADRLSRLSSEAYAALYDGQASALSSLGVVWKRLAELAAIDPRFASFLDQRDSVKSALEDLALTLRDYQSAIDAAPERLQIVEDRRAALERLKRKYGPLLSDVLERRRTLAEELRDLDASDDRIARLEAEEAEARSAFLQRATALSDERRRAGTKLGRALERALADLAMPNAVVEVRVTRHSQPETWTARGIDQVEFFLSANPGEEVRPLARIASGGELSRVMLALHSVADADASGRTLVFDEVDAGIGGAAADAVGARLVALGTRHQVICITHLAQVAARPGAHFQISKRVRNGRTTTVLTRLDQAGRETELARMIAGASITPQVLASARELLVSRGESEVKAKGESPARTKAKGRSRGA